MFTNTKNKFSSLVMNGLADIDELKNVHVCVRVAEY